MAKSKHCLSCTQAPLPLHVAVGLREATTGHHAGSVLVSVRTMFVPGEVRVDVIAAHALM